MAKEDNGDWGQHLTLGLEMAVGVLLGLLVGRWLDHKFGWSPWGSLVGAILGLSGGMYLLIKTALKMNRDK